MKLKTGKNFVVSILSALLFTTLISSLPARAAGPAPGFTLQSIDGSTVSLSQFKGQKPVLLYFFATWCHFCQAMGPKVSALRKSTPESQLAIVAIDVGSGDSLEKVKRYEKDSGATYTVLYDQGSKVTRSYGVEGIPNIVLVDKNGDIKYQGSDLPPDVLSLVK
ncbi:MAG: TlpA disulfide reductase family protein [Syntrophobacteraceae bacterium]|nr:TlpA disulfide reductase family protein [Syntrophobacteraceae bacterium]